MTWLNTITSALKNAQQAGVSAASGGNQTSATKKTASHNPKAKDVTHDLNSPTGARDQNQIETEQKKNSPKSTPEQEAAVQKLHDNLMEVVRSRVENRMHRLGLRNEDPRNKKINEVYESYLALKGGNKKLSAERYQELIDVAGKLGDLADEIEKRNPPTEAERTAFSNFGMSYEFKSGAPLVASIDGASGAIDPVKQKEVDDFYLSRASIVPLLDKPPGDSADGLAIGDKVFAENDWRPYDQSGWTGDQSYQGGIDCSDFVSEYLRRRGVKGDWTSEELYSRSTGELSEKVEGIYFENSAADIQRARETIRPGDYIDYPDCNGHDGHCGYMTSDGMIAQSGRGGVGKRSLDSFLAQVRSRSTKFMIGRFKEEMTQASQPQVTPKITSVNDNQTQESETAPTQYSGLVVCLDPGHSPKAQSGSDPVNEGAPNELEFNWEMSKLIEAEAKRRGIKVVMTKSSMNQQIGNRSRAQIANENNADIFLRIHAEDGNSKNSGFFVLHPDEKGLQGGVTGPSNGVIERSAAAADLFGDVLNQAIGKELNFRGVKGESSDSAVGIKQGALTGSVHYSGDVGSGVTLTLECYETGNKSDREKISDPEFKKRYAAAVVDGLERVWQEQLKQKSAA